MVEDFRTKMYDGEVANDSALPILKAVAEAIEEVNYALYVAQHAKGLFDQGAALNMLADRIHDLSTWHPGYSYDTGTLPWEREDEV